MNELKQLWRSKFVTMAIALILVDSSVVSDSNKEMKPTCDFQENDVKFFDIKITPTAVPSNLTTYVCQKKIIPIGLNEGFHAIGFLPLIGNKEIVHHMILFGCPERSSESVHRCSKEDGACRHFVVQWSRGILGPICNHPEAGYKLGPGAIRSMSLQIHWNNQDGTEGLADASGFRIFYTSKLRPHDMSNVQIGQNQLIIPPGQASFPQSGGCSPDCTKQWLSKPIYFTRAHIHMHYTGVGGRMEILRDGKVVSTVVDDPTYDYSEPPAHAFAQPFEVLPGDEVRVTCMFNTKDGDRKRNHTLYWGEGSDGEMCYAFVTYYPMVKDFDQCIQFDQYDVCTSNG